MSKDKNQWLAGQIALWKNDGLIDADQAARIAARYPVEACQPESARAGVSWGAILFFGFGAAVVGLGVILLLAFNWDALSRFTKLALVLGATAGAHAAGYIYSGRSGWQRGLGESLAFLGTMLFGAGIWLIAQIYNIDEHYPNGFMYWGFGALAMAWAMRSILQGLLAAVVLQFWCTTQAFDFHQPIGSGAMIIAAGLLPLAWRLRSVTLMVTTLVMLGLVHLANCAQWGGSGAVMISLMAFSAIFLAASKLLPGRENAAGVSRTLAVFGVTGFIVGAYLLSFKDTVRYLLRWNISGTGNDTLAIIHCGVLAVIALGLWIWLLVRVTKGARTLVRIEEWLCPIALIYCVGLVAIRGADERQFVAVIFNLVCLGVATMWMLRGCRDGLLGATISGSVLLSALVFARYFDLFQSRGLRGAVFILLGGLLFAEGFYYRRLRRIEGDEGRSS